MLVPVVSYCGGESITVVSVNVGAAHLGVLQAPKKSPECYFCIH